MSRGSKPHKYSLIAEDEAPIREMIRFALEGADFRVGAAADAQQARSAMAEDRPDPVLLDSTLPGVSGIELVRELRRGELAAACPIITGAAPVAEEDRVRGSTSVPTTTC